MNRIVVASVRTLFSIIGPALAVGYLYAGWLKFDAMTSGENYRRLPVVSSAQYASMHRNLDAMLAEIAARGTTVGYVDEAKVLIATKQLLAQHGMPNRHLSSESPTQFLDTSYNFSDPRARPLLLKAALVVEAAASARSAHEHVTDDRAIEIEKAQAERYTKGIAVRDIGFERYMKPENTASLWSILGRWWLRGMLLALALLGCINIAEDVRIMDGWAWVFVGPFSAFVVLLIAFRDVSTIGRMWRELLASRRYASAVT